MVPPVIDTEAPVVFDACISTDESVGPATSPLTPNVHANLSRGFMFTPVVCMSEKEASGRVTVYVLPAVAHSSAWSAEVVVFPFGYSQTLLLKVVSMTTHGDPDAQVLS